MQKEVHHAEIEDYDLLPHQDIRELKRQIEDMKSQRSESPSRELLSSMQQLTKKMDEMVQLFSSAAEELKLDEREAQDIHKKIEPLIRQVDRLTEQNKTIAEGMLAIADMIKELKDQKPREIKRTMPEQSSQPRQQAQVMGQPNDPFGLNATLTSAQPMGFPAPPMQHHDDMSSPFGPPLEPFPPPPNIGPMSQGAQPFGRIQSPQPMGMGMEMPDYGNPFGTKQPADDRPKKGFLGIFKKH
ncbi:TPA: hypothetical protein HA270_04215 [Candidatus Woesearchaeota archaeon]|nr:hypothetical protein [Candidatus Woesearchaeota archaeon]